MRSYRIRMIEIRIHGRGGLGAVTLSELLGRTALKAGMKAQTMPFFGVERRGADVKATVRLSFETIKQRSHSVDPDYLVLMTANVITAATLDGPHSDATIIVNSPEPVDSPNPQWFFNGTAIAVKNDLVSGGEPYINMPMLGAVCRALDLPRSLMEDTLMEYWGEKSAPNLAAAAEAYDSAAFRERDSEK